MNMKRWIRHAWRWGAVWGSAYAWMLGTSTCPCCGQPGCPVTPIGAGILATLGTAAGALLARCRRRGGRQDAPAAAASSGAAAPAVVAASTVVAASPGASGPCGAAAPATSTSLHLQQS